MTSSTLIAVDQLPARKSGEWAKDKLYLVGYYIKMFATGMKNEWPHRAYVDLMSGPGLCKIQQTGEEFDGSPLLALRAKDPFDTVVLIESEDALADALRARTLRSGCRPEPLILRGDSNSSKILNKAREAIPANALTLAFVDLIGLNITLSSISRLTTGRKFDLIITFPEMDLIRNALRVLDEDETVERQVSDWDEFFGSPDWRQVIVDWQSNPRGEVVTLPLMRFYERRLQDLGFKTDPAREPIKNTRNRAIYRLLFASKSDRGIDFWRKADKNNRLRTRLPFED